MTEIEFFEKLTGMLLNFPEEDDVCAEYIYRMEQWKLRPEEIDRLFNRIILEHKFFPRIAEIRDVALKMGLPVEKKVERPTFLCFSIGNTRHAIPVKDLKNVPRPPEGADNVHLSSRGGSIG